MIDMERVGSRIVMMMVDIVGIASAAAAAAAVGIVYRVVSSATSFAN